MKKYTSKQQEQVIEQYKNGIAVKDLVSEYGISRTTI